MQGKISVPVIDKNIIHLIDPNLVNGPWIAGGAALKWYKKQEVGRSDVDVFFRDQHQYNRLLKLLRYYAGDNEDIFKSKFSNNHNYTKLHESTNATTYGCCGHHVQLIHKRFYSSLDEVLDHFDFTICQIGTDGQEWYVTNPQILEHIDQQKLVVNRFMPETILKRFFKYWTYGYHPDRELVERIQSCTDLNVNFANSNDYDAI